MRQYYDYLRDAVFYGIVDTGYVPFEKIESKCAALRDGGAKIIQLRAKKENHQTRRELALRLLPIFQTDNAPIFIINDDVELAASLPLAGLHIGQDDIPPADARRIIGEEKCLGLSTHSIEQAKAADSLSGVIDYFAVGPVYATNTKPGRKPVGLELVKQVSEMSPKLPWFAIGGVNLKTAQAVRKSGAERIVAVSDVLATENTRNAVSALVSKFLLS